MSLSVDHDSRGAPAPASSETAVRWRAKRAGFTLMVLSALVAIGVLAGLWWLARRFS
jgi:hypothetical protein